MNTQKEEYDYNHPIELQEHNIIKCSKSYVKGERTTEAYIDYGGEIFTYTYISTSQRGYIIITNKEGEVIYNTNNPKSNTSFGSYLEYSIMKMEFPQLLKKLLNI